MTETPPSPTKPEQAPTNASSRSSAEERKMIYRLAEHIDENGRYNDALKPMSLAYGAGKGISEHEARQEIDSKFHRELGRDMRTYLEAHREARGLSNDKGRSM